MLTISRTPLRISFFGGGTDYPAFYHNDSGGYGAVLGTTIDQYTYISVKTLKHIFFDHKIRIAYSKTECVKEIADIEHPSIQACLRHRHWRSGLEIHIFSDLPARTGLGSSSSFTVGFLHALDALRGERRSPQDLADEARYVEQKCLGENVGSQDPFHSAFGGFNRIEFRADHISVHPIPLSQAKKKQLEAHLLVFFTGLTRHASHTLGEQVARTSSGKNDRYLYEMLALVEQAQEVLIRSPEGWIAEAWGTLLHESWSLKKQLSSKISTPELDAAYQTARAAGAYGG